MLSSCWFLCRACLEISDWRITTANLYDSPASAVICFLVFLNIVKMLDLPLKNTIDVFCDAVQLVICVSHPAFVDVKSFVREQLPVLNISVHIFCGLDWLLNVVYVGF